MSVLRRVRMKGGRAWRLITAPYRPLPGFIVIGAQKAGTSSLNYYLRQHPQVVRSFAKEPHFFDRYHREGERGYRAMFPLRFRLPPGGIAGEGSPAYIVHPYVPGRIAAMLPDVKLIAVLRDPVARAVSQYFMNVNRGKETVGFEEALRLEEERTDPEWERLMADENHNSRRLELFAYKRRGRYVEQLRRYFACVDRARILILSSDDLGADTARTLDGVCGFLGIGPMPASVDFTRRNVGAARGAYRNANEMPPQVIEALREYFRPYNRELYELLDRDFGWG
jgi:hypothetical protein